MSAADLSGSREELLSLAAAAKRLRVNYRRLREAVRAGDLPTYRVGGERPRVLWGEVVEWVLAQRVQTRAGRAICPSEQVPSPAARPQEPSGGASDG